MLADERATLDVERELAGRQAHDLAVVAPELGETTLLELLREDAQAGAIPEQNLAELARLIHEKEQLAAERVAREAGLHEPEQAVVAFAQIDRRREREHADRARRPDDHATPRRIAIAAAIDTPSIRIPFGVTSVTLSIGGASTTSTGSNAVLGVVRGAAQRFNVSAGTPIARARSHHHAPRLRCFATHAVISSRSAGENRKPGRPRFSRATRRRSSLASRSRIGPRTAAHPEAHVRTGHREELRLMPCAATADEFEVTTPAAMKNLPSATVKSKAATAPKPSPSQLSRRRDRRTIFGNAFDSG